MIAISIAIDRRQSIIDINFTKFALFCPEEAIITVEVNPIPIVQPPKPTLSPNEALNNSNPGGNPHKHKDSEVICCELL